MSTPARKRKVTYGDMIHRQVFRFAAELYGREVHGQQELLNRVREDIVRFRIAAEPSLSSLNAEQKTRLVNAYIELLGQKRPWFRAPASYRSDRPAGNPEALPTPDQRAELERRFDQLGWPTGEAREFFCERQCGRKTPPTRAAIQKVLGALRAMDERGWEWGQAEATR